MEDYAKSLKLTYNQVRTWFSERRRKEKKENEATSPNRKVFPHGGRKGSGNKGGNWQQSLGQGGGRMQKNSRCNEEKERRAVQSFNQCVVMKNKQRAKNLLPKKPPVRLQVLFSLDYILKRVFRKEGPPLGVEFDSLPVRAFGYIAGSKNFPHSCQDSKRISKKKKDSASFTPNSKTLSTKNAPLKRYGIGKGLMTVWHATNPGNGSFHSGLNAIDRNVARMCSRPTVFTKEILHHKSKKLQLLRPAVRQRTLRSNLEEKRKLVKRRKGPALKDNNQEKPHTSECKLAVDYQRSQENSNELMVLLDDEELELSELQAGPNPLSCSAHLALNGSNGCSLCKDMLPRFPPESVKMKKPMHARPWDSSPEIVKKFFKVFRFLYTHSVTIDICAFTLDEFVQAFHDKEAWLLGKIHVALLKLLLSDVGREISAGFLPRASKDCRFLGFLQSIRLREFDMNLWSQALNSLTWTEILRQVLVTAGFCSKQNSASRGTSCKGDNCMVKYGLRPRTLKAELFNILSGQGSSGLKVSELAKASQIVALDLPYPQDELELLICSTLSSDITLFEKIAPSAYRVRVNPLSKRGIVSSQSDTEDSGSVDDGFGDSCSSSSNEDSDDSELDTAICGRSIVRFKGCSKRKGIRSTEYTEIDESLSGEAWVLGLMESEYSNLSIEEKLDALTALVDLTGSGSSFRMEEPVEAISAIVPNMQHRGSGAKIKKSLTNQLAFPGPLWTGHMDVDASLDLLPVDSYAVGSKAPNQTQILGSRSRFYGLSDASRTRNPEIIKEYGSGGHPLQSIYLGSDRRYNSYWLFIGPCNASDPGHRRVYFESSEDGHWEVIDTEQDLSALLSFLDGRGIRESSLLVSLDKRKAFLCQAMSEYMEVEIGIQHTKRSESSETDIVSGDGSSPISDIDNNLILEITPKNHLNLSGAIRLETGKNSEEKKQRWDRLQAFDKWIWKSFYSNLNAVKHSKITHLESLTRCESCHDLYWRDEKHCKNCHTTFELDFDLEERYAIHVATCKEVEDGGMFPNHKVLPSQLQALKAAIYAIEAAMPAEALEVAWTRSAHKLWMKRLRRTSSLPELLQVVADFVGSINEDWLYESTSTLGSYTTLDEIVVFFQTMPQTTSALALWMVKLDTLLAPHLERPHTDKSLGSMPKVKRRRTCT